MQNIEQFTCQKCFRQAREKSAKLTKGFKHERRFTADGKEHILQSDRDQLYKKCHLKEIR